MKKYSYGEIEVYTEGGDTPHDICTAQAKSTGASPEMIVNTDGLVSIAHTYTTVKTFEAKISCFFEP